MKHSASPNLMVHLVSHQTLRLALIAAALSFCLVGTGTAATDRCGTASAR